MGKVQPATLAGGPWRTFAVWFLVLLGCLTVGAYIVVRWSERQILTPDNWVALVTPLPKQPVVYTALGNYVGDQLFAAVPVQQNIANALPPQASFLAGPLTGQLQDLAKQTAQKVVASDGFQTIWTAANRRSIERLVNTARGQKPPLQSKLEQKFNLNISDVTMQIRQALGRASEAIPALQQGSQQAINVTADLHARADRVRQAIRTIDDLAVILPLLAGASLLGALAISRRRRRTTMLIAMSLVIMMLVELVAVKALRQVALDQVNNPANLSAVGYIYDVLVGWLKSMIIIVLGLAATTWLVCLLAGPASWAARLRSYIFVDRIKASRLMSIWHSMRQWVRQWQRYLWLATVLLILIVMLAINPTGLAVINALLLTISAVALIYIVGHPPGAKPNPTAGRD